MTTHDDKAREAAEREAFEQEFKPDSKGGGLWMRKDRNGNYRNPSTQSAWQGWLVRSVLSAEAAKQEPADAKIKAAAFMQIARNSEMLFEVRDLLSTLTDPTAYCPGRTEEARRLLPLLDAYLNQPAAAPQQVSEKAIRDEGELPAVLFDGFAVLQALTEQARKRTSATNVADTLDAVVRLLRANKPTAKSEGDQP